MFRSSAVVILSLLFFQWCWQVTEELAILSLPFFGWSFLLVLWCLQLCSIWITIHVGIQNAIKYNEHISKCKKWMLEYTFCQTKIIIFSLNQKEKSTVLHIFRLIFRVMHWCKTFLFSDNFPPKMFCLTRKKKNAAMQYIDCPVAAM